MLILDQEFHPVDRILPFIWKRTERERMTTITRLCGKLVAYLPYNKRAYYAWALIVSYRPAQHISVYQFSPPHLRLTLFSRWEIGLILGVGGGLEAGSAAVLVEAIADRLIADMCKTCEGRPSNLPSFCFYTNRVVRAQRDLDRGWQ
jgi:hypothetical protein